MRPLPKMLADIGLALCFSLVAATDIRTEPWYRSDRRFSDRSIGCGNREGIRNSGER